MTALEKLKALREGGWIKACLEGTEWIGNEREVTCDADFDRPPVGKSAGEHAYYNAAKVEVTKVVLNEAITHIQREIRAHGDSDFINPALTLLQQLKESL